MLGLESIQTAIGDHGLILRGGFAVAEDDGVPTVAGRAVKSLVLVGNAGSAMWDVFSKSDEYRDEKPDRLNRWTARIGETLAAQFSARALFPFGDTRYPFLHWGKKAEALHNSHLGMLIHPTFGLWHAYRFALAFAESVEMPNTVTGKNICAACETKPCRPACPVNAFGDDGYDVETCSQYLTANPDSKCIREGCVARGACPQGAGHRYRNAHVEFHMRAFVVAMASGEFSQRA